MVYDANMERNLLSDLKELRNELCRVESFLDDAGGSPLDKDLAAEINRAQARTMKHVTNRLYNLIQSYTPDTDL